MMARFLIILVANNEFLRRNLMKKFLLCFLMCLCASLLSANVRSLLVEQTDDDELTVSFSSTYDSCTVHLRKNGTANWNSFYCSYGGGSLSINGLSKGTYEIRVTPKDSRYNETSNGKSCMYSVVSRWESRERRRFR